MAALQQTIEIVVVFVISPHSPSEMKADRKSMFHGGTDNFIFSYRFAKLDSKPCGSLVQAQELTHCARLQAPSKKAPRQAGEGVPLFGWPT